MLQFSTAITSLPVDSMALRNYHILFSKEEFHFSLPTWALTKILSVGNKINEDMSILGFKVEKSSKMTKKTFIMIIIVECHSVTTWVW